MMTVLEAIVVVELPEAIAGQRRSYVRRLLLQQTLALEVPRMHVPLALQKG